MAPLALCLDVTHISWLKIAAFCKELCFRRAFPALPSTLFGIFFRLLCAPRNVIFQNTFEKRLHARDCGLIFCHSNSSGSCSSCHTRLSEIASCSCLKCHVLVRSDSTRSRGEITEPCLLKSNIPVTKMSHWAFSSRRLFPSLAATPAAARRHAVDD